MQLGAEELGLQLRHPRNDIAFAIEVTGNGLTNEDLGDSIVTMSVSTNWYVKRLQEGKQIAIAKIENTRRVFSSLANCTELGETVECRAEFAGESRGFSVFTLVALSKAPMPTATSTPGWPSFTPTATELSYPGQPDVIPSPSGLLFSPDTTSTPISQPSPISMSPTPTPVAIATSEAPIPGLEPTPTALARIHRRTGMDDVRTAEGGEGVTGVMIRARIWVDGRLAGGLQALLGAPMAAYSGCGEPDGGIGHGKRRSRTGLARVCGDVGLAGGSVADGLRQAGSGMARSRARARLNCSSQGQRRGRCRVNRRAERVIRPAKAKTRRLRVLVVTIC